MTEQQTEAIRLLAKGLANAEVAKQLGIAERTIYRWYKNAEFTSALEQAKSSVVAAVVESAAEDVNAEIKKLLPLAIKTLQDVLTDSEKRVSDRLRAADIVGRWSGISTPQQQKESQVSPDGIQDFLKFLAVKNGNVTHKN